MTARPKLEVPPVASENTIEQETTPLLGQGNSNDDLETQRNDSVSGSQHEQTERSVFGIISVLLIGVFVSQADTTLVFATYAHITSEFIRLGGGSWIDGSWIVTSFGLATCATQPMYGRLSQIFGRKPILQMSYLLFLIGTAIAGLARNMIQMIIGRVIQGAGSAGMVSMVSILLTGTSFFNLLHGYPLTFYRFGAITRSGSIPELCQHFFHRRAKLWRVDRRLSYSNNRMAMVSVRRFYLRSTKLTRPGLSSDNVPYYCFPSCWSGGSLRSHSTRWN